MSLYIFLNLPVGFWIFISIMAVYGAILLFALCSTGDVFTEFSHGKTTFKLAAKGRPYRAKSRANLRFKQVQRAAPGLEIEKPVASVEPSGTHSESRLPRH